MTSPSKLTKLRAKLRAELALVDWRIAVLEFALEQYLRGPNEPTFLRSYLAAGMPPGNLRREG